MNEAALDINALSYAVRGTTILHNVSARIGKGETWSIIGANGAGKSTLLKCLMRIHTGWSGQVYLFGQPLGTYSQRHLAKKMAYVPQGGGDQLFPYTVREFIRMGRYAYSGPFGTAHEGDQKAIDDAIGLAGVGAFEERMLASLSGGERQKVYIAAALAQTRDMLLLDEPTAFLDYGHQAEVSEILHKINRETGTTILCVTHDVNTAILTGGKVLALQHGEVNWCGDAKELMCEARLESIYGTSFRLLDDPETGLRLVAPQGRAGGQNV